MIEANEKGASWTDKLTNKKKVTITGTAEAGATVELFDGATSLGTATANGSGVFSRVVTLDAGARSITATATDAAGNVGAASNILVVTTDIIAPESPAITVIAGDDMINASEQGSVIRGTAENGAIMCLSLGGSVRTLAPHNVRNLR